MDPALALLHVHRVARQVPVDDRVAVGVEVQPFLADGRRGEDERPERRVEGRTDLVLAGDGAANVSLGLTEADRKMRAQALAVQLRIGIGEIDLVPLHPARGQCHRLLERLDDALAHDLGGLAASGGRFRQHVEVLVVDRRQAAVERMAQDLAPVRLVRPRPVATADQDRGLDLVEQPAIAPADPAGRVAQPDRCVLGRVAGHGTQAAQRARGRRGHGDLGQQIHQVVRGRP